MAFIEKSDQHNAHYGLYLTDEEVVVLQSVLMHIGGAGKTRDIIDKILLALENGGFRHSSDIKGVIDEGDLKFRD